MALLLELRTKNVEEKEMVKKARDALKTQILNKEVELKTPKLKNMEGCWLMFIVIHFMLMNG